MNKLICFILAVSLTSCTQKPVETELISEVKVSYTTGSGEVRVVADTPFLVSPNCQDLNPNRVGNSYTNYQTLKENNQANVYHTNSEGKFTLDLEDGTYCISNIWIPIENGTWFNHSGNNKIGICYLHYKKRDVSFPNTTTIELQSSDITDSTCPEYEN